MTDAKPSHGPDYRGHIDFFGYDAGAGGLIFVGWVSDDAAAAIPMCELVVGFAAHDLVGHGAAAFYPRADLPEHSTGMVLFVPASERPDGELFSVATREHRGRLAVTPAEQVRELAAPDLAAALAPLLAQASPHLPEAVLAGLFPPPPAEAPPPAATRAGRSPLDALAGRVLLEVDHAILCPPAGVAIIGWMLAQPGAVRSMQVDSGDRTLKLDPARFVRVPRPGVIEAVGGGWGYEPTDERCGFIAYLSDGYDPAAPCGLTVTTDTGQTCTRALPPPQMHGMAAIRLLLDECDAQFADVAPAFDGVLGPAVESLAAARLRQPPSVARIDFGPPPDAPSSSVIVPLYGRLDYLEPQIALLAGDPGMAHAEVLLVLDDPRLRREAENLADSLFARFRLPLSLLLPDRNLGFAPACNVGLAAARGAHVCFLNSDAFPLEDNWLPRLVARLTADPALGLIGPLLLHEDGTVQHQGMGFRRQARFGNWYFSEHARLGLCPPQGGGLHPAPSITGACVVMPASLARQLGGFDPAYLIGDFEDSDLCLRARQAGFASAVDLDVRLCHLGRRSQASTAERWRMNLVLYNAWVHDRRWGETIARMGAA